MSAKLLSRPTLSVSPLVDFTVACCLITAGVFVVITMWHVLNNEPVGTAWMWALGFLAGGTIFYSGACIQLGHSTNVLNTYASAVEASQARTKH